MGIVVQFDYAAWAAFYPEFNNTVSEQQANLCFAQATIYHANDGSGPVSTSLIQSALLNMVTAHIAQLQYGSSQQDAGPLVGRISSASEGSVSAQTEYSAPPSANMAWYIQTKYGAAYWQATAPYRTMRYRAPEPRQFNVWPPRVLR